MNRNNVNFPPCQNPSFSITAPQFVTLSFDDNGYGDGIEFIIQTLSRYKNKDNSKYKAAFYLEGQHGLKKDVQNAIKSAYKSNHEIGCHSFSHPHNVDFIKTENGYKRKSLLSESQWRNEIISNLEVLTKPVEQNGIGIPQKDIQGFRTPYITYNQQIYNILDEYNFLYDASIEEGWTLEEDGSNNFWPYTLDNISPGEAFRNKQEQEPFISKHCGLWILPLYTLIIPPDNLCKKYGTTEGARQRAKQHKDNFNITDGKISGMDWNFWFDFYMSKEDAAATMKYTFDLRYNGNRCPFTIGLHSDIYSDNYDLNEAKKYDSKLLTTTAKQRREAFIDFLEYISTKEDCRVVKPVELIDWISKQNCES